MEQLVFPLAPTEPYGFRYFVPHFGVTAAYQGLAELFQNFEKNPEKLFLATVNGPKGSGKSHLIHAFAMRWRRSEHSSKVRVFDFAEVPDDGAAASLVAAYEELRRSGGVMLVALSSDLDNPKLTPHIASRLRTGELYSLSYPNEDELAPLVASLLERHNLQLSANSIAYLMKRLPRDPLSFDNIFAKISESSLQQNKPAGMGVIRSVI